MNHSGEVKEAELSAEISIKHLEDWHLRWRPFMIEKLKEIPPEKHPQHQHWNWLKKHQALDGQLSMRSYAVTSDNETQGMMWVRTTGFSQIPGANGKPIVYIEYIESAPWNVCTLQNPVKYRGIGRILLGAAIELSQKEEFKGRIGLHALSQAEPFYHGCGFSDLGVDHNYHNLRYYEMTEQQARQFLTPGETNV